MPSQPLLSREYLNWHEAAEILGMDNEGLRQAIQFRLSPSPRGRSEPWLPVVVSTKREGFLTSLQFDRFAEEPGFSWASQDSFYANCDGQDRLAFSDGSELLLRGKSGADFWEAVHNHGTGFSLTFIAGGLTLVVRPEAVRNACDHDGYFDSVDIVPRDWCSEGFPSKFFHVVERSGSMFDRKPINLFDEGRFLVDDVMRLRDDKSDRPGSSTKTKTAPPQDKPLRADTRENLLRVILALSVKANWPEREAVGEIQQLLDSLGFEGPSDDTIRKFLDEARALEADKKPK